MDLSKTKLLKKWFIRARNNPNLDYYALLGIELFESDLEIIETAASDRVALLEKMSNEGFEVETVKGLSRRVVKAKLCLSDRVRRIKYNKTIAETATPNKTTPTPDQSDESKASPEAGDAAKSQIDRSSSSSKLARSKILKKKTPRNFKKLLAIGLGLAVCSIALAATVVTVNRSLAKRPRAPQGFTPDPLPAKKNTERNRAPAKSETAEQPAFAGFAENEGSNSEQPNSELKEDQSDLPTWNQGRGHADNDDPKPANSLLEFADSKTDSPMPLEKDNAAPGKPKNDPKMDPKKTEASKQKPEAVKPTVAVDVPKHPFKNLRQHFQLPPTTNTKVHEIAEIVTKNRILMGAALLFEEEWARGKIAFSMKRSADDKQKWVVSKQNRSDDEPIPVAHFWKSETTLSFQWLPSAVNDEHVNFLQNGAIKLSTPDNQFGWLNLRRPVGIPQFQLTDGNAQVDADIPWLPSTKNLVVQISGFDPDAIPSHCLPEIASKSPAKMYFTRKEEEAFIWMEVFAIGKAHGYSMQAKLRCLANGTPKNFALSELGNLITTANRQVQSTQAQLKMVEQKIKEQANKKPVKPAKGKKGKPAVPQQPAQRQFNPKDVANLKKQLKAAQSIAKVMKEYSMTLPKLKGRAIPLEIYLQTKNHKILVATTATKKKESKKN